MNLDDVNSGAVTLPDAPLEFENQTTVDVSGWGYTSVSSNPSSSFIIIIVTLLDLGSCGPAVFALD